MCVDVLLTLKIIFTLVAKEEGVPLRFLRQCVVLLLGLHPFSKTYRQCGSVVWSRRLG